MDATDDLATLEAELAAVEAALPRLEDGTYGRCARCSQPIPDERLAADPAAATCGCADAQADERPIASR